MGGTSLYGDASTQPISIYESICEILHCITHLCVVSRVYTIVRHWYGILKLTIVRFHLIKVNQIPLSFRLICNFSLIDGQCFKMN